MLNSTIAISEVHPHAGPALGPRCPACSLHVACAANAGCTKRGGFESLASSRTLVRRGETLFRAGDTFHALYVVHSGFFKTYAITEDGRDQVNGFHMSGELMGMDGIESNAHTTFAVALEDSQVCVIPFDDLEVLCGKVPDVQRHMYRMMSHEIVRNQELGLLLGSRRAEERTAIFLLNLSKRFSERGYSSSEFHLRMTREEIGSYLGLTLETVSRVLSKFQDLGLCIVRNKHIQMTDLAAMAAVVSNTEHATLRTQH